MLYIAVADDNLLDFQQKQLPSVSVVTSVRRCQTGRRGLGGGIRRLSCCQEELLSWYWNS